MKKYMIWCEDDCSGFDAETIEEAMVIIEEEIWWTGCFDIVETETDTVVMTVKKDNAEKGLATMRKIVNEGK